jgi:hypothetical protein
MLRATYSFGVETHSDRKAGSSYTAAVPGWSTSPPPGVVSDSPVSSSVLRPDRIIGQPP